MDLQIDALPQCGVLFVVLRRRHRVTRGQDSDGGQGTCLHAASLTTSKHSAPQILSRVAFQWKDVNFQLACIGQSRIPHSDHSAALVSDRQPVNMRTDQVKRAGCGRFALRDQSQGPTRVDLIPPDRSTTPQSSRLVVSQAKREDFVKLLDIWGSGPEACFTPWLNIDSGRINRKLSRRGSHLWSILTLIRRILSDDASVGRRAFVGQANAAVLMIRPIPGEMSFGLSPLNTRLKRQARGRDHCVSEEKRLFSRFRQAAPMSALTQAA